MLKISLETIIGIDQEALPIVFLFVNKQWCTALCLLMGQDLALSRPLGARLRRYSCLLCLPFSPTHGVLAWGGEVQIFSMWRRGQHWSVYMGAGEDVWVCMLWEGISWALTVEKLHPQGLGMALFASSKVRNWPKNNIHVFFTIKTLEKGRGWGSRNQSLSYLCRYRAARAAKNIDIVACAYISQTGQHCYHTDQATWCYEQEQAN